MNAKSNMTERRIYELLGVKSLRKAIMSFERLKHTKDGRSNANYHPKNNGLSAAYSFRWYIIYNSLLHVLSLLLTAVYFVVTRVFGEIFLAADIAICILIVFNAYCLMLQRYTWIRLMEHVKLLERRRSKRIYDLISAFDETVSERAQTDAEAELNLIAKMRHAAEHGEDLVLTAEDLSALIGIFEITGKAEPRRKHSARSGEHSTSLAELPSRVYVTDKTERRVSAMQKIINSPQQQNVLFSFSVLTEDAECERIYGNIFPYADRDEFEVLLEALHVAYNKRIGRGGGAE